jgi:hypothetical protein
MTAPVCESYKEHLKNHESCCGGVQITNCSRPLAYLAPVHEVV